MKPLAFAVMLTFPLLAGQDDSFLIRGATVHPVASAEIQNGSVLVRDGSKLVGFALCHTAPLVEGRTREELRVLKLVLRDDPGRRDPRMHTQQHQGRRRGRRDLRGLQDRPRRHVHVDRE